MSEMKDTNRISMSLLRTEIEFIQALRAYNKKAMKTIEKQKAQARKRPSLMPWMVHNLLRCVRQDGNWNPLVETCLEAMEVWDEKHQQTAFGGKAIRKKEGA